MCPNLLRECPSDVYVHVYRGLKGISVHHRGYRENHLPSRRLDDNRHITSYVTNYAIYVLGVASVFGAQTPDIPCWALDEFIF